VRAALLAVLAASLLAGGSAAASSTMRLEVHLAPGARVHPHMLLLTLGGPVYCVQLRSLAAHVDASLACTDYGPNRYERLGQRAGRREDWGDPAYLAAVAAVPDRLRRQGVKISQLVVVGVSYSGYADTELVATHPELRPAALVVVDSYLDLAARYDALPPAHETRREMEAVLGGTVAEQKAVYDARSPSHHLDGLAQAIRAGMRLVVVWSVSPREQREFRGATCSRLANAQWLADLAGVLHAPVTGYVTHMPHAHALWDRGLGLLELAGVARTNRPLHARPVRFRPGAPPPAGSFCT
jgi:hypothetical protein